MNDVHPTDSTPIEHRTESGAYHAYHDWDDEQPLSSTIFESFVAVTDGSCSSSKPLYDSLDLEALDELLQPNGRERPSTRGHVAFVHDGYEIEVYTNGLVRISPQSQSSRVRPAP